jgi:hypothetical protein
MDEERRRRFAENEAIYRTVNENIEAMTHAFIPDLQGTMNVICECGNLECTQQITVTISEYERVRSDPTLFLVVPGHELPEVEVVVEERDAFTIVCKDRTEGREVAIATDPRG